jgi:hypothetical protein
MDSPRTTSPHDTNRFRIAALSLDDYAAGLAHDAGQSAYDLFKDYARSTVAEAAGAGVLPCSSAFVVRCDI